MTTTNSYRLPPRTSSLNPPLSPGLTPARQAQLSSSTANPYSHHAEDPLVFEVGSRLLRAGLAGEPAPRCVLEWGSEAFWCREGIVWAGGGGGGGARAELWRADLRGLELGVVEDVVERGARLAYNKYLLLDSKLKRVLLVTPPLLPTAVLTAVLKSLFVHFQMPGIMLLPSPTMTTLAAGTRHALILDLSWEHTTAQAIYDLRPVGQALATRRGARLLHTLFRDTLLPKTLHPRTADDIIARSAWCRRINHHPADSDTDSEPFTIPLPAGGSIAVPFGALAEPAERAFFAVEEGEQGAPDDDDLPLHRLVYEALRRAPVDVRAACMARIVVVGGASGVAGLKKRVVDEVRAIVEREGWCRRRGKVSAEPAPAPPPPPPPPLEEKAEAEAQEASWGWRQEVGGGALSPGSPRGGLERREAPPLAPRVRGVESLGAWVGASLVAGMKGRGTVEVERERFLLAVAGGGTGLPLGY